MNMIIIKREKTEKQKKIKAERNEEAIAERARGKEKERE